MATLRLYDVWLTRQPWMSRGRFLRLCRGVVESGLGVVAVVQQQTGQVMFGARVRVVIVIYRK